MNSLSNLLPNNNYNSFRQVSSITQEPATLQKTNLNAGHLVCEKNIVGRLDMIDNPATNISPGYKYLAAGSIVSSASAMSKLLRLVLNKGTVEDIKIFKSPSTIAEMITGKNTVINEMLENTARVFPELGYDYLPDGNSLSAGYGFDIIGNVVWGHAYVDKGGDTFLHHTTTGYAPNNGSVIAILSNSEDGPRPWTDQLRAYVMGIFLDVPKTVLDFQLTKWQASIPSRDVLIPEAPACGFRYWKNPPRLPLTSWTADSLAGIYEATSSPQYFPSVTITLTTTENVFLFQMGRRHFTITLVGAANSTMFFLPDKDLIIGKAMLPVDPDINKPGKFIVTLYGQSYQQK